MFRVEPNADHDVRSTDQLGRQRRCEAPRHVQRPGTAIEQALGHRRRREQGSGGIAQCEQLDPSVPGTPAGDQNRSPGAGQQCGQRVDVCGGRLDSSRRITSSSLSRSRALGSQHLERQVDQHRSALVPSEEERAGRLIHGRVGRRDSHSLGTDRMGHGGLVDCEVRGRSSCLGGQDDQRGPAFGRLGDPGHRIRQAATLVQRERYDLSAHPRIRVGHRRGTTLVPRCDIARATGDERVGDIEIPAAHDAERLPNAETGKGPADRLRRPHRGQYSISASTRVGLPEPPRIGSGAAITTVPIGGSDARFCNWVRPYLPAPSRYVWHGKAGSKE